MERGFPAMCSWISLRSGLLPESWSVMLPRCIEFWTSGCRELRSFSGFRVSSIALLSGCKRVGLANRMCRCWVEVNQCMLHPFKILRRRLHKADNLRNHQSQNSSFEALKMLKCSKGILRGMISEPERFQILLKWKRLCEVSFNLV